MVIPFELKLVCERCVQKMLRCSQVLRSVFGVCVSHVVCRCVVVWRLAFCLCGLSVGSGGCVPPFVSVVVLCWPAIGGYTLYDKVYDPP